MSIRRFIAALFAAAGLIGGMAVLVGNRPASAPVPIAVQPASSDDTTARSTTSSTTSSTAVTERSPSTSSTSTSSTSSSTTSTSTVMPPPAATASTRTVDAAGAGTVTYTVSGTTFTLVDATPNSGWTVKIEQAGGAAVDVDFFSGTKRVQVDVEFEDGVVRERVRLRDDADDSETHIENGVVVHTEPGDDERDGERDDD